MFETFDVPALYIAADAAMSLLQSGRTTGIVLEIGDDTTHTVPVYEGTCLLYCIHHTPMGGRSITDYLRKLLGERGLTCDSSGEFRRDIQPKIGI